MIRPSRTVDLIALSSAGLLLLALVLRWSIRDSVAALAPLFYATPPLVTGFACVGLAGLLFWNRRRIAPVMLLVLAVAVLAGWWPGRLRLEPCAEIEPTRRVLLWNTARGRGGWGRVARAIRASDADLIALVEAGGSHHRRRAFWKAVAPDHELFLVGRGLVLLSRDGLGRTGRIRLPGWSRAAWAEVPFDGGTMRVVLVDVEADPLTDRRPAMEEIFRFANAEPSMPTLVLGDFNTPQDSVTFDPVRERFAHAYESAGRGFEPTWPTILPVLTLDHVWVSRDLEIACTHHRWTALSDHSQVLVELGVRSDAQQRIAIEASAASRTDR